MTYPTRLQIAAVTLTTAAVAIVNGSCELDGLVLCNKSGSAATVTVQDANGKFILNAMPIQAHTTIQIPFTLAGAVEKGQYVFGSLSVLASANSAVDLSIMARGPATS